MIQSSGLTYGDFLSRLSLKHDEEKSTLYATSWPTKAMNLDNRTQDMVWKEIKKRKPYHFVLVLS